MITDAGSFKWALFQVNTVLSRTVEGLHTQIRGLAMLLRIIQSRITLRSSGANKKTRPCTSPLDRCILGSFIALDCISKDPELAKTIVLNEPPILPFLAKSPIRRMLNYFKGLELMSNTYRIRIQNRRF